jgi:subtilase family serine protease
VIPEKVLVHCGLEAIPGKRSPMNSSRSKPPQAWIVSRVFAARWLLALIGLVPAVAAGQSFSAAGITQAYGFNLLGANYTGAGQTIAVIELGGAVGQTSSGQTNIYTDVNSFDTRMNLPALTQGTNLTVMSQSGSTTSTPAYYSGWAEETTLDVEYAHAIAPDANIEVVEATYAKKSSATISNLYSAANYAAVHGGASVVSMSFTIAPEDSTSDSYFTAGQSNVAFVASTGDKGYAGGVATPASDPYVVAVGGTTLSVNSSGNYAGETAWSGSGGGTSAYEARPAYQNGVQSSAFRTVPDVAFDADPNTGVDIVYGGQNVQVGGTSLGAPAWAGLFALADQERAAEGLSPLSSLSALQAMYALYGTPAYTNAFHDIVGGNNGAGGATAVAGYDEVTGLGSPIANDLVPYLGGEMTLSALENAPEPARAAMIFIAAPLLLMRRRAGGGCALQRRGRARA